MPLSMSPHALNPGIVSVSDFVRLARITLESTMPLSWIAGEVSNLTRAASGHIYFSLKDPVAQVRCVMWKNRAQLLPFQIKEGMQIEIRAQITIYEPRGDMQCSVENIRHAGQGNLYEAFLRQKALLEAEGLFDSALKRPLPLYPKRVGVVTSLQAAALQDVLITFWRHAPALSIVIYPTPVQGDGAGKAIAQTILMASERREQDNIDALLVCRGGGSIEDLWAFNHEAVVRAIRASTLPVVSGVGHETDTTLTDFAADLRYATPSAAAEALSAGFVSIPSHLNAYAHRLQRALQHRLHRTAQQLDIVQHRLIHPRERLTQHKSLLAQIQRQLRLAQQQQLNKHRTRLTEATYKLTMQRPRLHTWQTQLQMLENKLVQQNRLYLRSKQYCLEKLADHLEHLNPQAVLQRGYAIVHDTEGKLVRHASSTQKGQRLKVSLAEGSISVEVTHP